MRCAAIVAIRNEEAHLPRLLADYTDQGIDVVILDNGSTDGSLEICHNFIGKGLLGIHSLPWEGEFNLSTQLRAKEAIINELTHDWIIHVDADEWLQSPEEGETLIEGIQRADQSGYNAVNFEEFVFLPEMNQQAIVPDLYWPPFHRTLRRLQFELI